MTKAGRPRKAFAKRYPGGKIHRESQKATTHIYWSRERDALRESARDPRLGTPLGILFRGERITAGQMKAGTCFADARTAADAALGLPRRNTPAHDLNAVGGASNAVETDRSIRRKRKALAAYDAAIEAVGLGSRELAALEWVVIYERQPDDYAMVLRLIVGLDRLARHYGKRGESK